MLNRLLLRSKVKYENQCLLTIPYFVLNYELVLQFSSAEKIRCIVISKISTVKGTKSFASFNCTMINPAIATAALCHR